MKMASRKLNYFSVLVCLTTALAKDPEPELPPCPTTFQGMNNLPMHCKMVKRETSYPVAPPVPFPPPFPPFFPGPIVGKPEENNPAAPKIAPAAPAPVLPQARPAGMPAMPMPAMPMGMPGMPMGMPGMPMGMPGMPMIGGPAPPKMPVIVMPFYSPDPSYKNSKGQPPNRSPKPYKRKIRVIKKSRHRHYDTDSSTDTDTDSSDTDTDTDTSSDSDRGFWNWKHRRAMSRRKKIKHIRHNKHKANYLTPILQYVSKDGYVIFEKQISKNEAKDWLGNAKDPQEAAQKEEEKQPPQSVTKYEKNEEDDEPELLERVKPTNKFKPVDAGQKTFVKFSKNPQRSNKNANKPAQQGPQKRQF